MAKVRVATAWLGGCSGCHMSFLDLDEKLVELAPLIDIVWGPLVDPKEYPKDVDVALVEGAVILEENRELIHLIRENSRLVLALGDCAITGNVPGMRNQFGRESVLDYADTTSGVLQAQIPRQVVSPLVERVLPIHKEIKVDAFIPGCPPSADRIYYALSELLAGRLPKLEGAMGTFG
jgi:NAD-reducing hydrogenase small subunit